MAAAGQVIACTAPTAAMQRISDAAGAGLTWFVECDLPRAKVAGFETKMIARYPQLARDRFLNHRVRKAGGSVYRLIVLDTPTEAVARCWLMTNLPDGHERWSDATAVRPKLWMYETVRQTKEGAGRPVWTWRIEKTAYRGLREVLIERIRKKQDQELLAFCEGSKKWAGFAGVRVQHKALGSLLWDEWRRSRGQAETMPEWPRLRYVQRLKTR